DGSFGGKVFAGYRFAPFPLFVEASYLDTGDADVDRRYADDDTIKLNFSGYTFGAGLFWPLTSYGSGLFVRGAYYDGDTRVKTPDDPQSGSRKASTSGASFAVGADWKFNPWAGLRVEYEDLIEPRDFENDESVGVFSLGVVFDFPFVRESRGRSRY
ncbi:MAG TPA: outer membrane beta-barrel protein, partial [Solimonas sp.]|nr:outer membrane beta-barrel protein [Solimonas sp.]